ncbi:MAG: hypothetical protein ACE37B_13035 [Ilumatobacter sp.]|uniref:hypothetical protein n=1 Tax=Ilumatobacter sp. TaxID=1967498 RepID=UPI003919AF65
MTGLAVVGDVTTTTTLAIAASWPSSNPTRQSAIGVDAPTDIAVVEADPTGGSVAAWLDMPVSPSLSAAVTALHHARSTGASAGQLWSTVQPFIRAAPSGPRVLPAPIRSLEARRSISEAATTLFPLLHATDTIIALFDVGRIDAFAPAPTLRSSACTVVVHRQESASAAAEAVRLERLAETMAALHNAGHRTLLTVVGDTPFDVAEIVEFAAPGTPAARLPVDPLAAAVLAGRRGVSERRLHRLPLMRAAAHLAHALASVASDSMAKAAT